MKNLELAIPIPAAFWKNDNGDIKTEFKMPHGTYNLYLKVPVLASKIKWLLDNITSQILNVVNSYIVINKTKLISDNEIMVQVRIGAPPLLAVLGAIAGVCLLSAVVLYRLERVIKVSYPVLAGMGALMILPDVRKPIVNSIKKVF